MTRPELLSPAGNWECARAAVENGADAIYFGVGRFNARLRAANFTLADLPALMAFLHRRGVKGYVTFNTLIFTDELADAEQNLRAIISAGVDAAIVQDIGICRLIRRLSPDFPIHGSTQMTVTTAAGVDFAHKLGASLVVLARECSIPEIEKIHAAVPAVPLEVFVHGALCVAYSGQCLTSESLGGRSANRGECAQACRTTYELLSDGEQLDLGDRRYLLSPQDLCGLEALPGLIHSGVASLKIEGRLKTPEYVANVTRVYREALDRLCAELPSGTSASSIEAEHALAAQLSGNYRYDLEMSFSRGLHTGWLGGIDNQRLVHARFGTKRGVFLGEVVRVSAPNVWLRGSGPVKPGDGVVFDAGRPDLGEEGGRIHGVNTNNGETALRFGRDDVDFARVRPGDRVWKTSDPVLTKRLQSTFVGEKIRRRSPVWLSAHGHAGAPLTLDIRDEQGRAARAESSVPLQTAVSQPLNAELLRGHLDRLGDTPFSLAGLDYHLEGAVMLPLSELNRLRRDLTARLDELRAAPLRWELRESSPEILRIASPLSASATAPSSPAPAIPELIAFVRTTAQLEAAAADGITTLYVEFEDPKRYRDAVKFVRTLPAVAGRAVEVWVAPPRIFKTGEDWILKQVRSCDADGYLVRNYDQLAFFAADRKRGDFSLNVANPLTAEYFISCGLERLTASYDLNIRQLDALLRGAPAAWFEITLHQHMPMFHMEHCVFCAFMSSGKDYRDCGRPCEKHEVRLRDRVGALHTLKADAGCRNTLFNARAQSGDEYAAHLASLGVPAFRIEFLHENAVEVARTLDRYRRLLRGELSGLDLWRELKAANQLGVTRGTLG